jgi:hypothetical protein
MALSCLVTPVGKFLFAALIRLAPLAQVPPVLALERWVLSNYAFSVLGNVIFRISYLLFVLIGVYLTYVLAMILWT